MDDSWTPRLIAQLICLYIVFSSYFVIYAQAITFYRTDQLNIPGINRVLHDPSMKKDLGEYIRHQLQYQTKKPRDSGKPTTPQPTSSNEDGFVNDDYSSDSSELQGHPLLSKSPESWTGRWFPEKPTTPTPPISRLQHPFGSLSSADESHLSHTSTLQDGRSPLKDSVQYPPSNSSSYSLLQDVLSLFSQEPETWTGRWVPDRTTAAPLSAVNQGSSTPDTTLQHSLTPELRTDSLMSRTEENWTGRWLPERTTPPPANQPSYDVLPALKLDSNSMWNMINSSCDDGKTNLTVDWDKNPVNYTCFNPHQYFEPDFELPNLIIKSAIPKAYKAKHECMDRKIEYSTDLPTFGTHRPAWPRYGEYKFLPRQRWLHSVEHGAVVMLYHPCAHPQLVNELKQLVASCLYRHIITPYTLLPPERPFALVTWGWALLMTSPDKRGVTKFIRDHALHGPEATSKDGQFSDELIQAAEVITDQDDSTDIGLCPQTLF